MGDASTTTGIDQLLIKGKYVDVACGAVSDPCRVACRLGVKRRKKVNANKVGCVKYTSEVCMT